MKKSSSSFSFLALVLFAPLATRAAVEVDPIHAVTFAAIHHNGSSVAFLVFEGAEGVDLTGDGEQLAFVLHVYDIATGTVTSTGFDASAPASLGDRYLSFQSIESRQGFDLNGDGDLTDVVIQVWDTRSRQVLPQLSLATAFSSMRWSGNRLAFLASEVRQGRDLNGDGDALDVVPHLFDASTGALTAVPAASNGLLERADCYLRRAGRLAGPVDGGSRYAAPTATLLVTKIERSEGLEAATELEKVQRGGLANAAARSVKVKSPLKTEAEEMTLDFQSNIVVLDIYGGRTLGRRRLEPILSPGEAVLVRGDRQDAGVDRDLAAGQPHMREVAGVVGRLLVAPVEAGEIVVDPFNGGRIMDDYSLKALLEEPSFAECRSLRRVFCGGEALTTELQALGVQIGGDTAAQAEVFNDSLAKVRLAITSIGRRRLPPANSE